MEIVPNSPTGKVLTSLTPDPNETPSSNEEFQSPFVLKGSRLFSGNGGLIFMGILAGIVAFPIIGRISSNRANAQRRAMEATKLLTVTTQRLSSSPKAVNTPPPILVHIDPQVLRVTAISLGHPRLAVINGNQVAEGDFFTVHTPTASVAVTLRVLKIGDGRIDLAAGLQLITVHLAVPGLKQTQSH
jgi:hypothetical protein